MIARWFPTGATLDLTVSRHKCEFEDPRQALPLRLRGPQVGPGSVQPWQLPAATCERGVHWHVPVEPAPQMHAPVGPYTLHRATR